MTGSRGLKPNHRSIAVYTRNHVRNIIKDILNIQKVITYFRNIICQEIFQSISHGAFPKILTFCLEQIDWASITFVNRTQFLLVNKIIEKVTREN